MMFPFGRRAVLAALAVITSSALVGAQQSSSRLESRPRSDSRRADVRQADARPSDTRQGEPRQMDSRQSSPGRPWWKDDQFKKDLGLSADQSARIDTIFQTTMPQLRQGYDELDRVEDKLSRLIEINADEAQVVHQIDRVEAVRSSLHKTRTLMHLHMRQILTTEQRLRFTALYEERERRQAEQRERQRQSQLHKQLEE